MLFNINVVRSFGCDPERRWGGFIGGLPQNFARHHSASVPSLVIVSPGGAVTQARWRSARSRGNGTWSIWGRNIGIHRISLLMASLSHFFMIKDPSISQDPPLNGQHLAAVHDSLWG